MMGDDLRSKVTYATLRLMPTQDAVILRFGSFEINLQTKELRKNGMRLRLSGQPFQVLAVLIEHAGEVVTREELHSKLWKTDTFVDFDHGLNNAIARIREVLDDSSGTPRYVETIPRRGYRFIAPVGDVRLSIASVLASPPPASESTIAPRHEIAGAGATSTVDFPDEHRFGSIRSKALIAGVAFL